MSGLTSTASNAEPGTRPSSWRASLLQRGSGAPEMCPRRTIVGEDDPVLLHGDEDYLHLDGKPRHVEGALSRNR
jgi:hypothetical protein